MGKAEVAEVQELKAQNDQLVTENGQLQEVIKKNDEVISGLEQTNKTLAAEVNQLKADLDEKDAIIAEIRNSKPTKHEAPTFEHKGKNYAVVIPKFIHAGETYLAKDVLENKKLQQDLIAAESGALAEVTEE